MMIRNTTFDNHRPGTTRRVAVFKSNLLPLSETFILEQSVALRRWKPMLFGFSKMESGLDLEDVDHLTLWSGKRPLLTRILARLTGNRIPRLRMLKAIRSFRPDLVHVHFGTELQQNWKIFDKLGVPIVATLHGRDITVRPEVWESGTCGRQMVHYPRQLRALSTDSRLSFIAVSRSIRDAAIEFGIPPHKITVQHIGIDVERFIPSEAGRQQGSTVLFVGRMVEKKGVPYLLQAMARVGDQLPDARLVLIGDGPELGTYKNLAQHLGIPADFLGSQTSDKVLEWMQASRILCLPSVTASDGDAEGFGMVILEAQACGIPVITSARGGRDEGIEDGVTGIAHAEKDEEAIAQGILALLQDDDFHSRMAHAARKRMVEKFALRLCTNALEVWFDEIVSSGVSKVSRR